MRWNTIFLALLVGALGAACDSETPTDAGMADAGPGQDAGPPQVASTDHCTYQDVPATAGAGGTVTSGDLEAGTAERLLDVPLGTSLAAYTARAEGAGRSGFLPAPDERRTYLAGSFAPAVGIETAPRIRALALSAGGETVVLMKIDLATSFQGFVHDVELNLGPEFSGKVMVASSHTHSSFGNYSGHSALAVGFGSWRKTVYDAIIEQLTEAAEAAIADLQPAQIGFFHDGNFDPENRVNRDRRDANDELAGGSFKDHNLFVVRVDTAAGEPMALLPVFGMHGTMHSERNAIVSTDSIGGIERVLEESFDTEVMVMHLQGAGGDVSPAGNGTVSCDGFQVCSDFGRPETAGLNGVDQIRAAWTSAGADMATTLELEMVTRTVALGPDWETFTIRDGALEYAPFDLTREADGLVYDDEGALISPIDEFNAPFSAALCSTDFPAFRRLAQMPGTRDLREFPYWGCNMLQEVDVLFELTIDVDFEEPPICETTRTTVSAIRLGDWMMATMPGEPVTLLTEHLRTLSPVAEERTIVVGYAQDHGGYLLGPEDWLSGGYEPSITFWGPLEGEYVAEQVAELFPLAMSPTRDDGNAGGLGRVATPTVEDTVEVDTSPIAAGTVPDTLPSYLFTRLLTPVMQAQPVSTVSRLDHVFFTWVGEDPLLGTPRVFLQAEDEGTPDTYNDVLRVSSRPVQDGDLILTWTPDPIQREAGVQRTHYYTVEFQAAAPMGMPGLTAVEDRTGLPTGRYRFRVEAPGYEITSDPFTVEEAELAAMVTTSGGDAVVTVGFDVPRGYRVITRTGNSNGFVPLRNATVTVDVGGTPSDLTTDGDGVVTVVGGVGATVIITDRFGNSTTLSP